MQVHLPAEPSCYPQCSFSFVADVASSCKGDGPVPLSKVLASYFQGLNVFHHVSFLRVSAPPLWGMLRSIRELLEGGASYACSKDESCSCSCFWLNLICIASKTGPKQASEKLIQKGKWQLCWPCVSCKHITICTSTWQDDFFYRISLDHLTLTNRCVVGLWDVLARPKWSGIGSNWRKLANSLRFDTRASTYIDHIIFWLHVIMQVMLFILCMFCVCMQISAYAYL